MPCRKGAEAMSLADSTVDKLRGAFASLEGGPPEGEQCPGPETLWAAVHCELPPAGALAVAKHTSVCADCAAEWRLAMRSEGAGGADTASPMRSSMALVQRWGAVAATAIFLIVAVVVVREFRKPETPSFRATEQIEIRSLVPEDEALPRDAVVLSWSPAGEGAVYSVDVATRDLTPIASKRDLSSTDFAVPREALDGLPAGETLTWKVEARLPDGRWVASEAFLIRIE
jgi:hypothetical protein